MPGPDDLKLLLWTLPALTTGLAALFWFRLVCARAGGNTIALSGFAAARRILDAAQLAQVAIQPAPGLLSDHFDPRTGSVRLSNAVYHGRHPAAAGVAARVAGGALQHAALPATRLLHNLAAIGAHFGIGPGLALTGLGVLANVPSLAWVGLGLFNAGFLLQVVCLPLQWDACSRAGRVLIDLGLFDSPTTADVLRVMNASAWTGLAAVLQPLITLTSWTTQ
jgi:Zn-dependent membrane protease YugP